MVTRQMAPTTSSTPTKRRRSVRRSSHAAPRSAGRPTAEQRVRAEGGPQDVAYYRCGCGCAVDGAVATHVACPHCGADQAW